MLEKHLQVAFNNSSIEETDDIPLFRSINGNNVLSEHQELAYQTASSHLSNASCIYLKDIWNLCAAFWGDFDSSTVSSRRQLFSEWYLLFI